jgi:magnesium transporter
MSVSSTVLEARSTLLDRTFDEPDPIWVVDEDGRFAGAVPVTVLFRATGSESIGSIATRNWPSVPPDLDQEHTAAVARGARVSEMAVVDTSGRFLGAVPATVLLDVVWREHMEDIHRLSGILHQAKVARHAFEDPLWRRLMRRLPWLVAGLAGCFVAALVVARFEAALARNVALAFFLPGIVYLADAIGTQTETIAVRGLSAGPLPLMRSLIGETTEGALIGSVLAMLAFPALWLIFGDARLAFGLSISLLAAAAVAGTLGMALPWAFAAAGFDPAYGSGPVGTIVQDVLSLLIYFSVMSQLAV